MSCLTLLITILSSALLQSVAVFANFQFEVEVLEVHDSVNNCGPFLDVCALYIDEMCLDPHPWNPDQECLLGESNEELDLRSGLPKKRTFSVTSQPWPLDFRLCIEVMDYDLLNSDDHIEDLLILKSLNTSSELTVATEYRNSNGRITLTLRFRVQCAGGYEGPHCNCLPHDDDVSGHYSCLEEGGISCLPGYTNTSNLCRQQDLCVDAACPSNTTCVNSPTSFSCEPPSSPNSPISPSPTSSTPVRCNCTPGMSCTEAEPECSSSVGPTTATTRQQQQDNRGEGSAMSGAVMAAIVGGLLVALLLSGVLVAAMVVFIRLRKKHSKFGSKPVGKRAPMKLPLALPEQKSVVTNPTYGTTGPAADGCQGDRDTLRNLPNPLYNSGRRHNSVHVENPLYTEHPPPPQSDGIYSVPQTSPSTTSRSSQESGEVVYSEPGSGEPDGVYSYATVGAGDGGHHKETLTAEGTAIEGNEYTRPSGPQPYVDAPYNTLDHGQQQQHQSPSPQHSHDLQLATKLGYSTLDHSRH